MNLEIDIEDHGLERRLRLAPGATRRTLRLYAQDIRDAAYTAAYESAPTRGDFRRAEHGLDPRKGNLKRAITRERVMSIPTLLGDVFETRVFVDQVKAPYAKWVVYGTKRKFAKSTGRLFQIDTGPGGNITHKGTSGGGMVFPETRKGMPFRMFGPYTSVAGNPAQNFMRKGHEVGEAFARGHAQGIAQTIGNLSYLTR